MEIHPQVPLSRKAKNRCPSLGDRQLSGAYAKYLTEPTANISIRDVEVEAVVIEAMTSVEVPLYRCCVPNIFLLCADVHARMFVSSFWIERASPWAKEHIGRYTYISAVYDALVQVFAPSTGNLNDITLDRVYMNIAVVGNIDQFVDELALKGSEGLDGMKVHGCMLQKILLSTRSTWLAQSVGLRVDTEAKMHQFVSVVLKHCASHGFTLVNFDQAEQFRKSSSQYARTLIPLCQRCPLGLNAPLQRFAGESLCPCIRWRSICREVSPHLFLAYLGEELGNSIDFSSLGLTAQSLCRNLSVKPGFLTVNCRLEQSLLANVLKCTVNVPFRGIES